MSSPGAPRYVSPRPVANAAMLILTVTIVYYGIAFVSQIAEVSLLHRAETAGITFAEAEANDDRQALIGIGWLLLFVVSGIIFIAWFYRSYKNLRPLGVDRTRYSPGWAIGSWFIPLANLWIPKQIANDIWRGTEPTDNPRIIMSPQDPIPAFLTFWWISWIVIGVLNFRISFSFETSDPPTLDSLQRDSQIQLANIAVWALAALLAMKVVRDITARQEERAARLARAQTL
jgi:Domain of unknown function (DUF4328)